MLFALFIFWPLKLFLDRGLYYLDRQCLYFPIVHKKHFRLFELLRKFADKIVRQAAKASRLSRPQIRNGPAIISYIFPSSSYKARFKLHPVQFPLVAADNGRFFLKGIKCLNRAAHFFLQGFQPRVNLFYIGFLHRFYSQHLSFFHSQLHLQIVVFYLFVLLRNRRAFFLVFRKLFTDRGLFWYW